MEVRERAGRMARHPVRNRRAFHSAPRHCGYCRTEVSVKCMGGIGARRGMLTAGKAPGPDIVQRGVPSSNGTVGTSILAVYSSTITGSLQIFTVAYSKGSNGSPTISLSGTGWVDLGGFQGNVATLNSGVRIFCRITPSAQTTTTITASASSTITWTSEEWLNVDPASLPVGPTAPFTFAVTTSTSAQTPSSNNRVTAADGELVWTFMAGRGPTTGNISQAFGGGATGNNLTNSGRVAFAYTGYEIVPTAGTSVTHTMSYTNTQGSANTVYGSISFAKAP